MPATRSGPEGSHSSAPARSPCVAAYVSVTNTPSPGTRDSTRTWDSAPGVANSPSWSGSAPDPVPVAAAVYVVSTGAGNPSRANAARTTGSDARTREPGCGPSYTEPMELADGLITEIWLS